MKKNQSGQKQNKNKSKNNFNKSQKNEVILLGDIMSDPVVNHIIDDDNGILIDVFYVFELKTKVITNKGRKMDESVLPVLVSNNLLNELDVEIKEGSRIFIRGSYRTYAIEEEEGKTINKQFILAHSLEKPEPSTPKDKYINRFNFEAFLLEKLYRPKFDKNNKPILNPKTKRPVPDLDENGKKQWTVIKKGSDVINDILMAINRYTPKQTTEDRQNTDIKKTFYLRCTCYGRAANDIAQKVGIGDKFSGSGYIRKRKFMKGTEEREVIEAVIVKVD